MKPLFNRYLLLCLAALLIVTAFVGCRQTPGGTDGTEGSDDVTSDVVEKPTAPVTDPDVESEESDTATETSGETDEETDNGDETPGEILWEPDVLAWYDVDHGSSVNSRPDHGWDPLYQQSPGLVTKGGIFRSATPLLGTYDQIDPVVAKQHLYWLGGYHQLQRAGDWRGFPTLHERSYQQYQGSLAGRQGYDRRGVSQCPAGGDRPQTLRNRFRGTEGDPGKDLPASERVSRAGLPHGGGEQASGFGVL